MPKILVSIPDSLLEWSDGIAKKYYKSRSEMVREAMRQTCERLGSHHVAPASVTQEETTSVSEAGRLAVPLPI